MTLQEVFVGIDVSKFMLDVAIYGQIEVKAFTNDETGIKKMVRMLKDSTLS